MSKSPAFQFYPADFLVGIMGMSDEEVGVYVKMLCIQWERGSLPNDVTAIKTLVHAKRIPSPMVLEKFGLGADGQLRNARLETEREKQKAFRESRAKNAKKGWDERCTSNARASSPDDHVHNGSICKTDALQSSSSESLSTARDDGENSEPPGFEPPIEKYIAAAALYSVPAWYAEAKWHVQSSKNWHSGRTPLLWRRTMATLKQDYVNAGSPPSPPKEAKPWNGEKQVEPMRRVGE
jgi:uncharacterized protein YdaU (DUF1376 family)